MNIPLLQNIIKNVGAFFFSSYCAGCGQSFKGQEDILCTHCFLNLPLTNSWEKKENIIYRKLYGRFPFEKAVSFLYFTKSGLTQHLIHQFKYQKRKDIAVYLTELFAKELKKVNWQQDIQIIIPVPIHKKKKNIRGYNQAELIALLLGETLQIAVSTNVLIKNKHTESQTRKSIIQRIENVKDVFAIQKSMDLENKHILLVDDVLTTGSTIEHCSEVLLKIPGVKLSIATLAAVWE